MFHLENIWALLLLPLPWIAWRWLPAYRVSRPAVEAPFLDRIETLTGNHAADGAVVRSRPRIGWIVLILIWAFLVLTLARPQRFEDPITRIVPTRDLLLAIDLSASMQTEDMTNAEGKKVDRLTATKEVLDGFLSRREGDRVGLIFFGNSPFVQAPFTDDLDVCRQLLAEAQVGMAGPRTMLGDAIGKGVAVFRESDLEEKVLILLTDGNDTGSLVPPVKAAEIARNEGVIIHCIAMGDPAATGEEKFDEKTLQDVCKTTGGKYFRAINRDELEGVYDEIDRMTTREHETISHQPVTDFFQWPLAAAFLTSLLASLSGILMPALSPRNSAPPLPESGTQPASG